MQIHCSVSHQRTLRVYFKEISFDFFPKEKKNLLFFELKKKQKTKKMQKKLNSILSDSLHKREFFAPKRFLSI